MIENKDIDTVNAIVKKVFGDLHIYDYYRMGGLTNRTFYVRTSENEIVVRLPGEGTEELINRKDEGISTRLACDLGIDTKLYYFDEKTGIKVSNYISNSITMHPQDLRKIDNIKRIAKILKALHTSNVDTGVDFDVIQLADNYEAFIKEKGGFLFDDFSEVKDIIIQIKQDYLPSVVKKPCHNDPLSENWILENDNRMYLVDWEYAGMNDPIWDLADVAIEANLDRNMEELLLESYFGIKPKINQYKAFQINKVLIDYLWSLWGKTRAIYDGQELENYAQERYTRMKMNIQKLEEIK